MGFDAGVEHLEEQGETDTEHQANQEAEGEVHGLVGIGRCMGHNGLVDDAYVGGAHFLNDKGREDGGDLVCYGGGKDGIGVGDGYGQVAGVVFRADGDFLAEGVNGGGVELELGGDLVGDEAALGQDLVVVDQGGEEGQVGHLDVAGVASGVIAPDVHQDVGCVALIDKDEGVKS